MMAHSKESKVWPWPAMVTVNALSYSFPQTSHFAIFVPPPGPLLSKLVPTSAVSSFPGSSGVSPVWLVFPFARALRHAGIPFMFCTAFEDMAHNREFADCIVVQKPATVLQIVAALRKTVEQARPAG